MIENNLNPVWEDHFTYEKISLEELSKERGLEITVWDFHKGSSNNFVGGVRIGPPPGTASKHEEWMDSIGDEVSHWEAMLTHPTEWVEQWHTLRHTMDPRDVLLAAADSKGLSGEALDKPSKGTAAIGPSPQGAEAPEVPCEDAEQTSPAQLPLPAEGTSSAPLPLPLSTASPPVVMETDDTKVWS